MIGVLVKMIIHGILERVIVNKITHVRLTVILVLKNVCV